ncbi:hypothetical protein CEXT_131531 [Caerostris extrusa]|uniref:Uncharacterized protein n=1 Tax=Caerostris extrusa TaxID=172846 RepID=A0AAV4N6W3_CAEEX|nr:hypothetical protein CEXT_131531 [Caerostris extrusa]
MVYFNCRSHGTTSSSMQMTAAGSLGPAPAALSCPVAGGAMSETHPANELSVPVAPWSWPRTATKDSLSVLNEIESNSSDHKLNLKPDRHVTCDNRTPVE